MPPRHTLATPGGRAAFLFDRHYLDLLRRACGPCPSALSRSTAEDAIQEVLQRIARPGSWAPHRAEELFAYALRAVRLTNSRLVREQAESRLVPFDEAEHEGRAEDPASIHAADTHAYTDVQAALARLTDVDTRRIAELHLDGVDRGIIAARVGATPRAVKRAIDGFRRGVCEERGKRRSRRGGSRGPTLARWT